MTRRMSVKKQIWAFYRKIKAYKTIDCGIIGRNFGIMTAYIPAETPLTLTQDVVVAFHSLRPVFAQAPHNFCTALSTLPTSPRPPLQWAESAIDRASRESREHFLRYPS